MAVTMSDIAKHTGSSISSVSAALKGNRSTAKVSEKKRRQILEAAKQLGYRPSHAARTLKIGKTMVLGMAIGEIHTPYYGEMTSLLMEEAEKYGYSVQTYVTNWDKTRKSKAIDLLLGGRCDGILDFDSGIFPEHMVQYEYIMKHKVPVVVFSDPISGFSHIGKNWESGFIETAEYLLSKGISRIMFLGDHVDILDRPKLRSMVYIFKKYGLELEMVECHNKPDNVYKFGCDFKALENRPQVIMTENDTLANALLKGLSVAGVKVPGEVGVIGYNNTNFSRFTIPSLTTIGFDKVLFVRKAVEAIIKMIDDESSGKMEFILPTYLVKRDSV